MARLLTWRPVKDKGCKEVYALIVTGTKWKMHRSMVRGVVGYVLWEGSKRHPESGCYNTSTEAMDVADELAKRQT